MKDLKMRGLVPKAIGRAGYLHKFAGTQPGMVTLANAESSWRHLAGPGEVTS